MADKNVFQRLTERITGSNVSKTSENVDGKFWMNSNNSALSQFFGTDVFNEEEMTPHTEMMRVREMIDNNAFIASGLSKYQAIFMGENIEVEAEDSRTKKKMNDWLEESGLVEAFSNGGIGEHFKGVGNAYYHVKKGTATGMPKEVELIAKPENMWIRKNPDGSVKDYILEVPQEVRDMDSGKYETYTVSYGGTSKTTVIGIKYNKEEIVHVPQGMHQVPPYGRSDLASASSDEKILREIERSYAVIARHKQVPKKIFEFYQEMDGEKRPIDSETWEDDIKPRIQNLRDTDNMLLNGITVDKTDYNYSGQDIKMQETIDYLKRKITGPVLPQSLMHPDMTTQATAEGELKALFLQMRGEREEHKKRFNPVLRSVAEEKGLNTQGLTLSFGDLDLQTAEGKKKDVLSMWDKGVLTLNEVRDRLGLPEDQEFPEGDPYKWEVSSQPAPQQVQQTLRQALGDEE